MLGFVVIGRNEGERLKACLESIAVQRYPIVYVDSGSTDGSPEYARSREALVVDLDMSIPFTAGRARNAGFEMLMNKHPDTLVVQFVDGDCLVCHGWSEAAVQFFESHSGYAVVCGKVSERYRESSIYNRVMAIEWDTPCGDIMACGGIFAIQASVFKQLSGFNPRIVAGEEPELCSRIRNAGWKIKRLATPMAIHDSAMFRFSQWWKRCLRSGYGGLAVYQGCPNDNPRPFEKVIMSSRCWAVGFPTLVIIASILGFALNGKTGFILGLLLTLGVLPAQIGRIAWRQWRSGLSLCDALGYAALIMIAKVPEFLGQMRLLREQRHGISAKLIEHKS